MDAATLEYQRLIARPSTPLPKQSLGRPADGPESASESDPDPDPNTIPEDRLPDLINELLEYWAEPTYDELAICRALGLTLTQVEQLAANPRFRAALDAIDRLRAQRQPALDRRRADIAESALTTVAASPPTTAAATREKRLAANTLRKPTTPTQPAPPAREGMEAPAQPAPTARDGMATTPDDATNDPPLKTTRIAPTGTNQTPPPPADRTHRTAQPTTPDAKEHATHPTPAAA